MRLYRNESYKKLIILRVKFAVQYSGIMVSWRGDEGLSKFLARLVVMRLLYSFRRESFEFLYGFTSLVVVETVCKQRIFGVHTTMYIIIVKALKCIWMLLNIFMTFFFYDNVMRSNFLGKIQRLDIFDTVAPLLSGFSWS